MNTSTTRQPTLTANVLAQLGIELDAEGLSTLKDIASHSADAGWHGFTYYTDTVAFFQANREAIIARLKEDAADLGEDPLFMVSEFSCLNGTETATSIAEAIYGPQSDSSMTVQNALAWYALEEIARELCPDV